jgi:hypothetical protein
LCDRIAIIDDGQIVADGTPEQLKGEMGHDVVSVTLDGADRAVTESAREALGGLERNVEEQDALALYVEDGASSIAEIVRRLDGESSPVGAISVSRPSLDDVFLRATDRRLRLEGAEAAVTEIELGYFDKLLSRRSAVRRSSLAGWRQTSCAASSPRRLCCSAGSRWARGSRVDRSGRSSSSSCPRCSESLTQASASSSPCARNVQAAQSSFLLFFPLLFLMPNFVPFDRLSPAMETLARINPVSHVIVGLRSLVIDGWDAGKIGVCLGVIVSLGAILTGLSRRGIANYDR